MSEKDIRTKGNGVETIRIMLKRKSLQKLEKKLLKQ